MSEHSRLFAPSLAYRWMHCTASPHAVQRYKGVAGESAMEGTAAHHLLEICLVRGEHAVAYLGRTIRVIEQNVTRDFVVDRDFAVDVQVGLDAIREVALLPGMSRVEVTARLPNVDEDLFGRVDVWHISEEV
jgi:hypothetical protein